MIPTFIIEWSGPYKDPDQTNQANILYLITGSRIAGKESLKLRYIGKTSKNCKGRFTSTHKFYTHIRENNRLFWIGKIKWSNSAKNDTSAISKAEKILVHYLKKYVSTSEIDLMNVKSISEPQNACGVINRWFDKNGNKRKRRLPSLVFIPDVILWDNARGFLVSIDKCDVQKDFLSNTKGSIASSR